MKKMISLLVVVITMTMGLSPPAFAAPDFGTENQFTIEQATLDMDITIDVTMDLVPVSELQMIPEPIYLEGVVIMYPHFDEGYMLQFDKSALSQTTELNYEGPLRLELYSRPATWRFQETYS